MKLNIPLHKRIHQFFCRHKVVGWGSQSKGINRKEGQEYVTYECCNCGISVSEWFDNDEWERLDFPDEYTIKNKRSYKR